MNAIKLELSALKLASVKTAKTASIVIKRVLPSNHRNTLLILIVTKIVQEGKIQLIYPPNINKILKICTIQILYQFLGKKLKQIIFNKIKKLTCSSNNNNNSKFNIKCKWKNIINLHTTSTTNLLITSTTNLHISSTINSNKSNINNNYYKKMKDLLIKIYIIIKPILTKN